VPDLTIDEMIFKQLVDDVRDIRQGVAMLGLKMSEKNYDYEHRLTKVEVRSGIFATIVSAIVSGLLGWKLHAN